MSETSFEIMRYPSGELLGFATTGERALETVWRLSGGQGDLIESSFLVQRCDYDHAKVIVDWRGAELRRLVEEVGRTLTP